MMKFTLIVKCERCGAGKIYDGDINNGADRADDAVK